MFGRLVDRAEDRELFAAHAAAYESLRERHPDLLAEILDEDRGWHESDLAQPPRSGVLA